jgi:predicted nucleic acid-binding protein
MIAVSNTTPPRYLIAIGQDDLLAKLFKKVFVPTGVHEELTDLRTPEAVRRRVLSLAGWYEVRAVQQTQEARFR